MFSFDKTLNAIFTRYAKWLQSFFNKWNGPKAYLSCRSTFIYSKWMNRSYSKECKSICHIFFKILHLFTFLLTPLYFCLVTVLTDALCIFCYRFIYLCLFRFLLQNITMKQSLVFFKAIAYIKHCTLSSHFIGSILENSNYALHKSY